MKKLFLLGISLIAFTASAKSVAINADGSSAHTSALVDLKSNSQEALVAYMTATQRGLISSWSTGLLMYQTYKFSIINCFK